MLHYLDTPDDTHTDGDDARKQMARKAFLSLLSHELRTPLNSVIGFSEVLTYELYGPLGAPQYVEYAHLIRDSGLQILTLVKNALDLVRLESGHAELEIETRELEPVLTDFTARFADEARERGIRLDLRIESAGLSAACDDYTLSLSLDQLMLNALEYTDPGQTITLEAFTAGDETVIRLFNPCKAPPQREIERLMRPFEKGDDVRHALKGSGLGWPIVKYAMKAMDGRFDIVSDPRSGLTVVLSLKSQL